MAQVNIYIKIRMFMRVNLKMIFLREKEKLLIKIMAIIMVILKKVWKMEMEWECMETITDILGNGKTALKKEKEHW